MEIQCKRCHYRWVDKYLPEECPQCKESWDLEELKPNLQSGESVSANQSQSSKEQFLKRYLGSGLVDSSGLTRAQAYLTQLEEYSGNKIQNSKWPVYLTYLDYSMGNLLRSKLKQLQTIVDHQSRCILYNKSSTKDTPLDS